MRKDGLLDIAVGLSAKSRVWKNQKIRWSDLVKKLSTATKTTETFKEYMKASKQERGKIKDVGGYVGGYLRGGRRKQQNVISRQLITLDIDFAHLNFWDDFTLQFDNAAIIHTTHSHSKENPRYRLIMPLSREVSPDEYSAISRKVGEILDIELFDNTGFQVHRLMFWSSVSKDSEYCFYSQEGDWLDADQMLAMYKDWTDSSSWATSKKQIDEVKKLADKQEDPEDKKGVVGAFCRAYTIQEVIQEYLSDIYVEAGEERYTYTQGTTSGGLVVYDDKFAFSHHGTDPCSEKLCNAFDLVRIHLYGSLDEGTRSVGSNAKSFKAMESLCQKDKAVKKVIAEESLENAKYDFAEGLEEEFETTEETEEENLNWAIDLEVDTKGKYLSSASNISLIISNDKHIKNAFKLNTFDNRRYLVKNVAWRKIEEPEPVKNVDYSGIRNYIESVYGIVSSGKIDDALSLEFERKSFHPIKEYLDSLEWDGIERVNTLLIDYLGAEDNEYTRQAIRKTLAAAVARIYEPGAKFDLVLTLVGDEGIGKSTLVSKLGKSWFSDSFTTVHGKEAFEQLQGAWLIEMAELSGLRKAEVEAVKHFISKQEDTFRPAYARSSETYKRQCVFIGTTNNKDFLVGTTGNRRFIPIDVDMRKASKDVWSLTDSDINSIWAEAVNLYKDGEKLFLEAEANRIAKQEQKKHSKYDERTGIVEEYLNKKLPKDWDSFDIVDRIDFLNDELSPKGEIVKEFVCVAEIWCECLGKDKKDMDRYKTRDLHEIMRSLEDWERSNSTRNFKIYGKQKYYQRKLDL